MNINTRLLHDYPVVDPHTGAASIPKYQTSTFNQECVFDGQEYTYTRFKNPTVHALDEGLKMLADAKYALSFASGMAAISTSLMLLEKGDHIILPIEVYGGTYQFTCQILTHYGIEVSYIDMADLQNVERAIKDNTRMIYIETPSNPLLKITDIKCVVNIAQHHDILTIADNTFMTTLYQNPLHLGVDISVESLTKFINGHSDVTGGFIATNNEDIYNRLCLLQKNFGGILGVEEAWLVLRGMKTMGIRMERSVKNAQAIAEFLDCHPNVQKVYYPGLVSHRDFEIHQGQASSGGAVLSFELKSKKAVDKVTKALQIPIIAVSLGGVESIVSYPCTMSHACLSPEERLSQGVTDNLLRLSCGIEDTEDLLQDFDQALRQL
ncbi:trans-sulfuration enzyme family protein [Allofustis seminis]|uniref:trans-sulfuration enzyme family protein n=1 Tax=Allofustis seminis TaxID=166939 RepID=UPI000368A05B|nr:PLP-dependent aspartate aminotransferase family protein [Allofustis seminis]